MAALIPRCLLSLVITHGRSTSPRRTFWKRLSFGSARYACAMLEPIFTGFADRRSQVYCSFFVSMHATASSYPQSSEYRIHVATTGA